MATTQVILKQNIPGLGAEADVVKVKAGFARNYLIPQGKAKRATPDNLKVIEAQRAELEAAAAAKLTAAQELATRLEGLQVKVTQKSGVDGRLFGSVTNVDIVEALKGHGIEIEKSSIRLPTGPLKTVGDHPISIALHTDVVSHINVTVIGETVSG